MLLDEKLMYHQSYYNSSFGGALMSVPNFAAINPVVVETFQIIPQIPNTMLALKKRLG